LGALEPCQIQQILGDAFEATGFFDNDVDVVVPR